MKRKNMKWKQLNHTCNQMTPLHSRFLGQFPPSNCAVALSFFFSLNSLMAWFTATSSFQASKASRATACNHTLKPTINESEFQLENATFQTSVEKFGDPTSVASKRLLGFSGCELWTVEVRTVNCGSEEQGVSMLLAFWVLRGVCSTSGCGGLNDFGSVRGVVGCSSSDTGGISTVCISKPVTWGGRTVGSDTIVASSKGS